MRTDISKYLFHGVRKPNKKHYPSDNDDEFLSIENNHLISEFDVLKNIVQEGALRCSFSYRNGKPTVYGNQPVVCFTEMPLLNIIQYEDEHKNNPKISTYGIAVLKKELFKLGALPVISGLSGKIESISENSRILVETVLPLNEQFRYVYLNLNNRNIDWTHEREWRIKANDDLSIRNTFNDTYYDIKGLNVFDVDNFSECVIVVKTPQEADEISEIVEHQLDMYRSNGSHDFSVSIKFLVLEEAIKAMEVNKLITSIEKMPKSAFFTYEAEKLSKEEEKLLIQAVEECKKMARTYANIYIDKNVETLIEGVGFRDICGFAYVRSYHTRNKFIRFLVKKEYMYATADSSYTFKNLDFDIPRLQGLTYHEFISRKHCEFLNEKIGDIFIMESVWD